jgi:anti-sigma B factor antagonist
LLTIATESIHGVPVLRVAGSIERGQSNDDFVSTIGRLFESSRIVICDVSGISSIDSTGIATLIVAHKLARSMAGRFALVRLSPKVQSILTVTRLIDILDVFADENAALKGTQNGPQGT